jgi:hypothetical protein
MTIMRSETHAYGNALIRVTYTNLERLIMDLMQPPDSCCGVVALLVRFFIAFVIL